MTDQRQHRDQRSMLQPRVAVLVPPFCRCQLQDSTNHTQRQVDRLVRLASGESRPDIRGQRAVVHLVEGEVADRRHDALEKVGLGDD